MVRSDRTNVSPSLLPSTSCAAPTSTAGRTLTATALMPISTKVGAVTMVALTIQATGAPVSKSQTTTFGFVDPSVVRQENMTSIVGKPFTTRKPATSAVSVPEQRTSTVRPDTTTESTTSVSTASATEHVAVTISTTGAASTVTES